VNGNSEPIKNTKTADPGMIVSCVKTRYLSLEQVRSNGSSNTHVIGTVGRTSLKGRSFTPLKKLQLVQTKLDHPAIEIWTPANGLGGQMHAGPQGRHGICKVS